MSNVDNALAEIYPFNDKKDREPFFASVHLRLSKIN